MKSHFITWNPQEKTLFCQGAWDIQHVGLIKKEVEKIAWPSSGEVTIDGKAITKLDSAGAWLLKQCEQTWLTKKLRPQFKNFSEQQQQLLSFAEKQTHSYADIPKERPLGWLAQLGKAALSQITEFRDYLSFVGELSFDAWDIMRHPSRWRWRIIASVINKTGSQALPIIALLSFMIGVVISYQMGNQLRNYGANIFIVNLLGLSVLREFGPLLTAIMVSGRTGSAFTAQLGIMNINQEIDALNTMGITSSEVLLLPRLIGLFIVLPLLTIWADIFGVIGGMVMANNMLGISWYDFLQRFQHEIPLRALLIGLGKAPVFALIISSIGCFQGMQVAGGAESVGMRTTRSVVLAIFFIIIVDAIFSVIFSKFQL